MPVRHASRRHLRPRPCRLPLERVVCESNPVRAPSLIVVHRLGRFALALLAEALNLCARDLLLKPLDQKEVLRAVRSALRTSWGLCTRYILDWICHQLPRKLACVVLFGRSPDQPLCQTAHAGSIAQGSLESFNLAQLRSSIAKHERDRRLRDYGVQIAGAWYVQEWFRTENAAAVSTDLHGLHTPTDESWPGTLSATSARVPACAETLKAKAVIRKDRMPWRAS